ncbi:hypothetical protein [Litorihabitans aurantiacus]|nr:hypothetical protein [Litorihabitans aurantiacus]
MTHANPSVTGTIAPDGSSEIVADGIAVPVAPAGTDLLEARAAITTYLARRAAATGPVTVEVTDPEVRVQLMVHPDGTVSYLSVDQTSAPDGGASPSAPAAPPAAAGSHEDPFAAPAAGGGAVENWDDRPIDETRVAPPTRVRRRDYAAAREAAAANGQDIEDVTLPASSGLPSGLAFAPPATPAPAAPAAPPEPAGGLVDRAPFSAPAPPAAGATSSDLPPVELEQIGHDEAAASPAEQHDAVGDDAADDAAVVAEPATEGRSDVGAVAPVDAPDEPTGTAPEDATGTAGPTTWEMPRTTSAAPWAAPTPAPVPPVQAPAPSVQAQPVVQPNAEPAPNAPAPATDPASAPAQQWGQQPPSAFGQPQHPQPQPQPPTQPFGQPQQHGGPDQNAPTGAYGQSEAQPSPATRREARSSFLQAGDHEAPATQGLRGALQRIGIKVAPSQAERNQRSDESAVAQHWPGTRTIAVVNGKGARARPRARLCSRPSSHVRAVAACSRGTTTRRAGPSGGAPSRGRTSRPSGTCCPAPMTCSPPAPALRRSPRTCTTRRATSTTCCARRPTCSPRTSASAVTTSTRCTTSPRSTSGCCSSTRATTRRPSTGCG